MTVSHSLALAGATDLAPSPVATLRGDDALSRAAADVAAPRLRLLRGLRDAHADTCTRIEVLRAATSPVEGMPPAPLRPTLLHLLAQAEEQFRRVEQIFAQLRERPASGRRRLGDLPDMLRAGRDARILALLEAEERRGADDAVALRDLANTAGHHLAARLLDMTADERLASARELAAMIRRGRATRH